jgi:hypothetical protein
MELLDNLHFRMFAFRHVAKDKNMPTREVVRGGGKVHE